MSAEVVAADSVMGWVNSGVSVVSTVVSAQVSTIVAGCSQTVSVSVSTGSMWVSTISITVVGSGISLSLGFSLSLSITLLTESTGNGNVSGVDTGSTLNSVSVDAIVSSIMSVSSKTVSGVATISGISQTGVSGMAGVCGMATVSTVSSQAIAVAVVGTAVVVGIKDSGVGFSLSLGFSVGSDDKGGDNCNL